LSKINLSIIKDNNLFNNLDYYILDNPSLNNYKDYLPKLLLDSKSSLFKRYISRIDFNNKITYKTSNINKFYIIKKKFLNLLALAIYLITSNSLRSKELVIIIYKNTRDNIRNIIFNKEKELVLIITNYYKSYNITRKEKENLRFLNKDLSTILIYYLVYIIPLYYYFNIEYLELKNISSYLLENKGTSISNINLSNTLFKISFSYFKKRLSVNSYRYLINYIIKEKLNYNINLEEKEKEEKDNIINILANRSSKIESLNYSRDLNLSLNTAKKIYNKSFKLYLDYFKYFNINKYILNNLEINTNLAKVILYSKIFSTPFNNTSNSISNILSSLKSSNILKLEGYL
jgi:hypothetical protein